MPSVIAKVKTQIELWKVGKYTKRRSYLPEFEPRDKDHYRQSYHDGVYLSSMLDDRSSTPRKKRILFGGVVGGKRKSVPSFPPPQCSETYTLSYFDRSY
ncbi:hypothetical protein O0I10_012467 [Lichtheimia ornata]|uniref:Uncharacterized protein n=1 Tax=Lichtheimia ornata TaxID=688661 RepID=A0AAD7USP8_9FUNG|nr:uncharacterized protein O0I10_012467 [Lichtheimia ornata]KAJ8651947.1 hypothetical protein O0I10_012467 [Lichtheimia ornata]